jgi:hypothetical protein
MSTISFSHLPFPGFARNGAKPDGPILEASPEDKPKPKPKVGDRGKVVPGIKRVETSTEQSCRGGSSQQHPSYGSKSKRPSLSGIF